MLAFTAIFIYTRLLGKQQIGQLTFFEYVNGITFGSMAAVLATDIGPLRSWYHLLGLTVFAALTWLLGYFSLKSRPARKLITGEPTVIIHNGQILEENMRKMRYNLDELMMQLRENSVFNVDEVEYAILEPNGKLSVQKKSQNRPVTPRDLQLPTNYEGMATEIIMDGKLIYQNIKQMHLDEKWLIQKLQEQGIENLRQVNYASLDSQGKLYLDLMGDNLPTVIDISDQPG